MYDNIKGDTIISFCRSCKKETKQIINTVVAVKSEGCDDWWKNDYMIIECLGCETVSFREDYIDSSSFEGIDEVTIRPQITIYPPRENIIIDVKKSLIPKKIRYIYEESIKATNNNCLILAAAGFRSVIEAISLEKSISEHNLEKKINKLHELGHITIKESERLHKIRFIGNESIHEIVKPSLEELIEVNTIIKSLINNLYVLDRLLKKNKD